MNLTTSISSSRHPFHYAPFRNLFFARLLTVLGNGIAPIALAFAVLDIGGSATDLGLVVAARSIFNVAFLLIGGGTGGSLFPKYCFVIFRYHCCIVPGGGCLVGT